MIVSFHRASLPGRKRYAVYGRAEICNTCSAVKLRGTEEMTQPLSDATAACHLFGFMSQTHVAPPD